MFFYLTKIRVNNLKLQTEARKVIYPQSFPPEPLILFQTAIQGAALVVDAVAKVITGRWVFGVRALGAAVFQGVAGHQFARG